VWATTKGSGRPTRADISKKRRAPRGCSRRHVVGWEEEQVGEHPVGASAEGFSSRGGGEESLGNAWGRRETGVCVRAHGKRRGQRSPPRGAAGVGAAGHLIGPAPRRGRRVGPIRPTDRPRQPPWGEYRRGGRRGGRSRHPVRGPARIALPRIVARRAGTPRHATRWLCDGRRFRGWNGRGPSSVDSPPRGHPKISRSGPAQGRPVRISGRSGLVGTGVFPSGFTNPRTTFLNFSLWKELSAWRNSGGFFGGRRSR